MYWLYSVPNLLVIQYLETLFLGGNNVRVVCERVWRFDQECAIRTDSQLELATDSEWWLAKMKHTCEACRKLKSQASWITTRQKSTVWLSLVTGDWNSRLIPVASEPCFAENWLFTFHLISYYKYPYTHKM